MVDVKRRDNENANSLIRRFTRKVQQSGVLLNARKIRFFAPAKSKLRVRREAKMREEIAQIKEKLRKIGKDEEKFDIHDKRLFRHLLKQK